MLIADKKYIGELLDKISKSDDQQAFKALFDRYHSWLYTVAYTLVKSNEDAEEILEDVFVKIWEIREGYDRINNIETYLYTAVKNKCYDRFREREKIQHVGMNDELVEVDFMESPEDTFLYKELDKKIKESIERLPPKCQETYLLIKESGSSYKQAAESLSVSQKTIESQMRIAVKKIAQDIDLYLGSKDAENRDKFLSFSVFLLV